MREWNKQELTDKLTTTDTCYLYLYTPLCGTCQVASKMLKVVSALLPELTIGKCDLNYLPEKAKEWEIESVPCLVTFNKGSVEQKIYAFKSVEFLYEKLKG